MTDNDEGPIDFNSAPLVKNIGAFITAFLAISGASTGFSVLHFLNEKTRLPEDLLTSQIIYNQAFLLIVIELVFLMSCIIIAV